MTSVPQLAPEGSVIDAAAAGAATGVDGGTAGTRDEGTVEPPSTAPLDTSAGVREADVDADKLGAEGAVEAELAPSVPSVATGAKRKGGKSGGSKGKKRSKVVAGGGELAANGDTPSTVTRPNATLPQPHEEGFLASCMKCIQNNMGAYKRGEWEREPWAARPYATVGDYQIPPDVPEEDGANLLQKLACSLPHNWVGEDVRNVLKLHRATGPVSIDFSMDEPLKVGVDLRLCDLWGIDCHTRTAICDVLRHLPDFYEASTRERFIEHVLLPAANASGARGWDILAALSRVEEDARRTEDSAQLSAVEALTKVVRELDEKAPSVKPPSNGKKGNKPSPPPPSEATDPPAVPAVGTEEVAPDVDPATKRRSFRLHPKGQGVVCMRESGVAEGTLVSAYYGDIYPSWRWYERQDALKKANPNSDLPDFYNITMERPSEDPRGYDVLFIDGAMKGTFASRLSHSCAPNCVNIPIIRNDRLEIHMYTCRRVEYGEELCWDYACVTESEKEWAAAICLCGSSKCRGSFLYYAGTTAFAEFLNAKHGFLERNAMLARAVMEPLTESDTIRLAEFGIKDSALTNVTGERIPNWLIKWASLATECISEEEAFITAFLEAHPKYKYTAESAALEAKGVKANRIFNIVTTLDKIKYCMRNQKGEAGTKPPLVPLKPREVCEYLWSSPQSIARRCVEAASRFISPASGGSKKRGQTAAGKSTAGAELVGLQELLAEELTSPSKVYAALQQLSVVLRAMGPQHNAMADLLMMYSSTRSWFRAVSLETFKSPPVSFEGDDRVPPNLQRVEQGSDAEKFLSRRYTGQYCWGQLVSWFKQTIYNPEASLSADRRGTMSLPDPESAYSNPRGYNSKERQQLLNLIEKSPNKYFPTSFIWSFKNPAKIYGSPQLDAAIANALGQESRLPKLLQQLRSATR